MPTEWTNLVKEKFRVGRLTNPKYSLMEAMKAAKKVYKKTKDVATIMTKKVRRKSKGKTGKRGKSKGKGRRTRNSK